MSTPNLLLVFIWLLSIGRAHFGQLCLQCLDVRRLRGYQVLPRWLSSPRCGSWRGELRRGGYAATRLAHDRQRFQQEDSYRLVGIDCDNRNANRLLPAIGKLTALRRGLCSHLVPKIVSLRKRLVQRTLAGKLSRNNSCAGSDTRSARTKWMPCSFNFAHQARTAILH